MEPQRVSYDGLLGRLLSDLHEAVTDLATELQECGESCRLASIRLQALANELREDGK